MHSVDGLSRGLQVRTCVSLHGWSGMVAEVWCRPHAKKRCSWRLEHGRSAWLCADAPLDGGTAGLRVLATNVGPHVCDCVMPLHRRQTTAATVMQLAPM